MVSPKGEDKRKRIVAAAIELFRRYGFKRTSVDLLAAEAGVAKPTIYVCFADKDAIFRAVVQAVCDELLDGAEQASRGPGPLEERLTGMLAAKFTRYFELVQASPHAQELIDSHGQLGADIVQRADRSYAKLLTTVLEGSGEIDPRRAGLSTPALAHLLLRAGAGAAYEATTVAMHRKHLAEMVRVVVKAVRT